jgi:hypothetical protein
MMAAKPVLRMTILPHGPGRPATGPGHLRSNGPGFRPMRNNHGCAMRRPGHIHTQLMGTLVVPALLVLLATACSTSSLREVRVTRDAYGSEWPFMVPYGTIRCVSRSHGLWVGQAVRSSFVTDDGRSYPFDNQLGEILRPGKSADNAISFIRAHAFCPS